MRQQRHSTGGVRKQRGRWLGLWYEDGIKKSRVLGLVRDMTKGDAREAVAKIVTEIRATEGPKGEFCKFVENIYLPFYGRKWKQSTQGKNVNRINVHLVKAFKERDLTSFRRDELQDFLDGKAGQFSYSIVNHLRWDLKQIFDMAVSEGYIRLNPALLAFTPREAKRPIRRTMSVEDVHMALEALHPRERLIGKMAILGGMRPGEIFAVRWCWVGEDFVEVVERVYEGVLDTPKSNNSYRKVALPCGAARDLREWRSLTEGVPGAFVFPSERGTPLSKHNVWQRNMQPKLKAVGLGWCTFQVMRRTFATLSKANGGDAKTIADQCGHDVGVSLREYTQTSLERKLELVNGLERLLLG